MPTIRCLTRRQRKGISWMEGIKSVLVQNGEALHTIAAYIDINPVRTGLDQDPRTKRDRLRALRRLE